VQAGEGTFLRDDVAPYYVFLALLLVYLAVYRLIQRSRTGWAFRALRDDHVAAELSGVDVGRYRVYAGAIGSAMLGLSGAIYAHTGHGHIGTTTYGFGQVDVRVLVMLALGGIASLLGPVLGAVILTWLDELLVDVQQLRLIIYGVVLIVLFIGLRRGIGPTVVDLFRRWGSRRRRPEKAPELVGQDAASVDPVPVRDRS